jgi:hypothetical protein
MSQQASAKPTPTRIKRGEGSYVEQRNALKLWSGLLPYFEKEFAESKALLLDPQTQESRQSWTEGVNRGTLRDTFEDLLTAAGVTTYGDGGIAFLGAYMSFYDFKAAEVVCAEFNESELVVLRAYYQAVNYLSPIYGLVAGSCRDELERRNKKRLAAENALALPVTA